MDENIAKKITVIYSLFGDLTSVFSNGFTSIVKEFPAPDFSISNFLENINQRESVQGYQIKSPRDHLAIKIYFNRIDFVFSPEQKEVNEQLTFILRFQKLFSIKFNRLAINTSFLVNDEKDAIKKRLTTNLYSDSKIGNQTTEFSFKIGKIIHLNSEEINSIFVLENGFIQNIDIRNGMAIPSLKKALVLKTDVNTTQKNATERFDVDNTEKSFKDLYMETEKQISTILNLINEN